MFHRRRRCPVTGDATVVPGKVRESDAGPFYRSAEPAAPKSFAQDVSLYLLRLTLILVTVSMTLTSSCR
jgi:hypothetical protein